MKIVTFVYSLAGTNAVVRIEVRTDAEGWDQKDAIGRSMANGDLRFMYYEEGDDEH